MRNLFLLLLLANLALLAWQRWVLPPPVSLPVALPDPLPLITPGTPARVAGRRCVALGPFADGAVIGAVAGRLRAGGLVVTELQRPGQDWLGHWVRVAGLASLDDAEAARRRLVAGGLTDAYIMQLDEGQLISLGVFRERSRAEAVARRARDLGYEPRISDRARTVQERWLRIELTAGERFDSSSLGLPASLIIRTEEVRCDAPPEEET